MSYLLDALRKSELERRVGEVPKMTPELAVQSPPRKRHPFAILVIALVLINFGTLFYITFRDRSLPNGVPENPPHIETPDTAPDILEKAEPGHRPNVSAKQELGTAPHFEQKPAEGGKMPLRATQANVEKQAPAFPPGRSKQNQTSAGEPRARRNSPETTPPPAVTTADKPAADMEHQDSGSGAVQFVEAPSSIPEPSPATEPANPKTEAIPFLADLPRDFQRDLPTLVINVFVYSEILEERFVIINMKKYSTGQKIDVGPEILEIRADSLVLAHLGRKFRVRRP